MDTSIFLEKIDLLIRVLKQPVFYLNWDFWNTLVLIITVFILLWYTVETHKIAVQTKESNLRPVILRSGYLPDWKHIKFKVVNRIITGQPIQFRVSKNIATNINGFIVINRYKYDLLFGNQITQNKNNTIGYLIHWGWQDANTDIYAIFDSTKKVKTNKLNQICINYQDIEKNNYHTIENSSWSQSSVKGLSL